MTHSTIRPWPKDVVTTPGLTKTFIAHYRKAFDADPEATFCAGTIDGITIVLAVNQHGRELEDFVRDYWLGEIQESS